MTPGVPSENQTRGARQRKLELSTQRNLNLEKTFPGGPCFPSTSPLPQCPHLWKPVIILTCSQIVPSLARGSFLGWALSSFNKNRRVLLAPLMSGRTPCCRLILRFPVRISCFFKKPWFLLVSSGISRSQQK